MIEAILKKDVDYSFKEGDRVQVFGFFWHSGEGLCAVVIAKDSFTHVPVRDLEPNVAE